MRKGTSPFLTLTVLGYLALGATLGAATLKEEFSQTYAVSSGGEVSLSNTNGNLTVSSWDRDEVKIEATKTVRGIGSDRARQIMKQIEIEVSQGEDSLEIETHLPRSTSGLLSWLFGGGSSTSVSYRLRVPRHVNLSLTTVNGTVSVEGVRGELHTRTVNGRIEISQADGKVRAATVNGSIRAEFAGLAEDAEMSFRTTNGSISLSMPESLRAELDARTVNGRVSTDFSLEHESTGWRRRRVQGEINGGGGRLSLRTVNGSIRLASR